MLLIDNKAVAEVLTMADTIEALENAYTQHGRGEAVCRPRIDIQIPTRDPDKLYRWGTMEGGSMCGYFAIRMKSDILYERRYGGAVTQEKYCREPGTYCGLILLTSVDTGEPLAIINDGVLQHMRVGADGGIGVKYAAREDVATVGMLGSGGQARSHMAAFMAVRPGIRRLRVYSPTRENCAAFAAEVSATYGIEAEVCPNLESVYEGADILAAVTDSATPVLTDGGRVEPGTHIIHIGGGGTPGPDVLKRIDVYLRFGDATPPLGQPQFALGDEYLTYAAEPVTGDSPPLTDIRKKGHTALLPDRMVTFADIVQRNLDSVRADPAQITYSERGNLQGQQFWSVAGVVYDKARAAGLGRELPSEWFLQDIRN